MDSWKLMPGVYDCNPETACEFPHGPELVASDGTSIASFDLYREKEAQLAVTAPDLLEAAQLLEAAEDFHANCDECEGLHAPECCEKCFPLVDDARVKRRLAIAKATGTTDTHRDSVNERGAENT